MDKRFILLGIILLISFASADLRGVNFPISPSGGSGGTGTGNLTGGGTANQLAYWTSPTNLAGIPNTIYSGGWTWFDALLSGYGNDFTVGFESGKLRFDDNINSNIGYIRIDKAGELNVTFGTFADKKQFNIIGNASAQCISLRDGVYCGGSTGGGNPFNQILNKTSDVIFNNTLVNNSLNVGHVDSLQQCTTSYDSYCGDYFFDQGSCEAVTGCSWIDDSYCDGDVACSTFNQTTCDYMQTNYEGTCTVQTTDSYNGLTNLLGFTNITGNLTVSDMIKSKRTLFGDMSYNSPQNSMDVVIGDNGTMTKGSYEMASFERNNDAKLGVYSSAANVGNAVASLLLGATRYKTSSNDYPGFETQFVSASDINSGYWRLNSIGRGANGVVTDYLANIILVNADGRVTIGNAVPYGSISNNGFVDIRYALNVTKDITALNNVSVGQLLKLNQITLPNCGTFTSGSLARNGSGVYYCNSSVWKSVVLN